MKTPPLAYPVVLALAAIAAGLYTYSRLSAPAAPGIASPPPAPPQQAPPEQAPPATPVPDMVPDVKLPDVDGKLHSLKEGAGHQRVFNFWATWCEPCLREIPLLNALQVSQGGEGLQVVGIAVDFRDAVVKFQKQTPLRYRVLVGEEEGFEAAQKFGMGMGLPFTVFAGADDRIIAVKLGELHADEIAVILSNMRSLRAGTTTFEAARQNIADTLKSLAIERAKQTASK